MAKKTKRPVRTEPTEQREFAFKIALFNSLLFSFLLAAVTFVDARLTTHFSFGARYYRWGYLVAGVGGLLVFIGTLLSLLKVASWKLKSALSAVVLLIVGAASLRFFRPDLEFPHKGITTWTMYLAFISLVSCGIRYSKPSARVLEDGLPAATKIRRVKQYASLWRAVAGVVTLGYLAMLVPWAAFLQNDLPAVLVSKPDEKILLGFSNYALLIGVSLYAAYGIAYGAFKKANEVDDLLTNFEPAKPQPKRRTR